MIIVGLDLSLTSSGVAIINTETGQRLVDRVTSKGRKDATLQERAERLNHLSRQLVDVAWNANLVVVEGPSFGQARQGGQHDRAGLWWLTVHLLDQNMPTVEISPASRSKYATGKGNAAKDAVLAAVVRRYTDVEVTGNDEADALILAAMGARHLGVPIETNLPATHTAAMDNVHWPALEVPTP